MKKKSHQQGNKPYPRLKLNLKCCLSHIVTHSEDSKDFPFHRGEICRRYCKCMLLNSSFLLNQDIKLKRSYIYDYYFWCNSNGSEETTNINLYVYILKWYSQFWCQYDFFFHYILVLYTFYFYARTPLSLM